MAGAEWPTGFWSGAVMSHSTPSNGCACSTSALLGNGMLVSMLLGDWVLPFVYNVGIDGMRSSLVGWMFLGAMTSLGSVSQRHVKQID